MLPKELDNLVRRLARLKWRTTGGSEDVGGSQIDGVYRTPECTHLVEVTIERDMDKVRIDINKLVAAKREEEKTAFLVDCWMVVPIEPTNKQRELAHSARVRLVTVEEFLEPVLCKQEYLHLRPRHFFGSVGDPAGKDPADKIVRFPTSLAIRGQGQDISIETLAQRLLQGDSIVLLGDFGAGKSLAVREIFHYLDKKTSDVAKFPVALNLREHWGQTSGDELFTRHAARIGSANGLNFYQATKEGFVTLLLDGFDELAPQPWVFERASLKKIRRHALEAVRRLLEERHPSTGVLLAGRTHYFADAVEIYEATGMPAKTTTIVDLRELTDTEAAGFLSQHGVKIPLSRWLPKRPLFLSYLARTGYTNEFAGIANETETGMAWSRVIDMVCAREATVSPATDKQTIMTVLCCLAHSLRARADRLGPITDSDLESAFRTATGHLPDHDAWAILQRLPGLTFRSEGQRWFVDTEWADALAGGALAKAVRGSLLVRSDDPKSFAPLGGLGRSVAASELSAVSFSPKDCVTWAHGALQQHLDPTLIADCIAVCDQLCTDIVDFRGLVLHGAYCGEFDFTESHITNMTFEDCQFELLVISEKAPSEILLRQCDIIRLDGVATAANHPTWLVKPEVHSYAFPHTNAEVMQGALPEKLKVAIVVLRKIFLQPGRGRQISALFRGMSQDTRLLVTSVVRELERLGYVYSRGAEPIVHAVRAKAAEIRERLAQTPDPKDEFWKTLLQAK